MEDLSFLILILFAGIAGVTVIDVVGSITSRKYNFNYAHFTVFSMLLYITVAYFTYQQTGNKLQALSLVLLLGVYDGTVGWWISKKLNANYGRFTDSAKNMTMGQVMFTVLLFSFVFGWIGIFFASELAG